MSPSINTLLPSPGFWVGELSCEAPAYGLNELGRGEVCWCLRESLRKDVLFSYSLTDDDRRKASPLDGACLGKSYLPSEIEGLLDILGPYGMGLLKEALTEARDFNPRLVRTGPDPPVSPEGFRIEVEMAQLILNYWGYGVGVPDGKFGPRTSRALREFQSEAGVAATGELDGEARALLRNSMFLDSEFVFSGDQ
ncbi:MAG: peptidoglycan-binding protein [Deltaproteobacteria bacterium]|jgi:hypothetical protein|nr:peptidoglycan-binding protein [Deltaproteobacteria bacterium]